MGKLNIEDVPWNVWASPKGKFRSDFKELSIALGAERNTPVGSGGHPFDLTLERLEPGQTSCPYHVHAAQWELFYVLRGEGTVRTDGAPVPLRSGDVIVHPPGEAHQIVNTGAVELVY